MTGRGRPDARRDGASEEGGALDLGRPHSGAQSRAAGPSPWRRRIRPVSTGILLGLGVPVLVGIAALGEIDALKIISRTSAMSYRHTEKRIPEIARTLQAEISPEEARRIADVPTEVARAYTCYLRGNDHICGGSRGRTGSWQSGCTGRPPGSTRPTTSPGIVQPSGRSSGPGRPPEVGLTVTSRAGTAVG